MLHFASVTVTRQHSPLPRAAACFRRLRDFRRLDELIWLDISRIFMLGIHIFFDTTLIFRDIIGAGISLQQSQEYRLILFTRRNISVAL